MTTLISNSLMDPPSSGNHWVLLWKSLAVAALAGITIHACMRHVDLNQSSEAGVTMSLPPKVGEFSGEDGEISPAERTILPKDTEFARKTYTDRYDNQLSCSIVLSGGEKRSIHRPEICLPGQGWTIASSEEIPITLRNGEKLNVMKLTLSKEIEVGPKRRETIRGIYLYWFVGRDRSTPSHLERMLITSWDRVVNKINHRWAYVIVSATITDNIKKGGKNADETLEMLKSFISESVPSYQHPMRQK